MCYPILDFGFQEALFVISPTWNVFIYLLLKILVQINNVIVVFLFV